jgi:hypothetical protein
MPVPSICTYRIGTGFQLYGAPDFSLLTLRNIGPNGFCRPLHGFSGHLQVGEQLHLLASMIEGYILTDNRLHAAHPRRGLRVLDVQFDIGGKLARVAARAQVVGTQHCHFAHHSQHGLRSQFSVMSVAAASTGNGPLLRRRGWELQQFGQRCRPCLMHDRPHDHLGGFQIQVPRLTTTVEDKAQQLGYFPRDFRVDRFGGFFSRVRGYRSRVVHGRSFH